MKRLLIADDDEDLLSMLQVKLDATGRFLVETALGGKAAVQKAGELHPDLVICDIDMPDLDGGGVAEALAASPMTKRQRVLFLSSLVSPRDAAAGEIGGWPMVSKRTPFEELLQIIDASLEDSEA